MRIKWLRPSTGDGCLEKVIGWEARLREYGFALLGEPVVWGQTDCHVLALGALSAMTADLSHGELIQGKYSNALEAVRYSLHHGHMEHYLTEGGALPVDPEKQAPAYGDFVMLDLARWHHPTPGVDFSGCVLMPAERGGMQQIELVSYSDLPVPRILRIQCPQR